MRKKYLILLLLILALGAFLRFYEIKEIPLGLYPDEAMNGSNALEALETGNWKIFYPENNGREGLFINIQAISVAAFGNTPWALRVVSALFGTLTILGAYLVTRELFISPSSQAQNAKRKTQNDNPKRKSFKFLAVVLRFSLYAFRSDSVNQKISRMEAIALLSAFFTATSYWHLNFSRIGFRAIMVPFLASFGIYFLLKGLRLTYYSSSPVRNLVSNGASEVEKSRQPGEILDSTSFRSKNRPLLYIILAGIFIGLGFHTYIAFRFMPFVVAIPLIWHLWEWIKETQSSKAKGQNYNSKLKSAGYPF